MIYTRAKHPAFEHGGRTASAWVYVVSVTLVNSVNVDGGKGNFPFLVSSSFVLAFVLLV